MAPFDDKSSTPWLKVHFRKTRGWLLDFCYVLANVAVTKSSEFSVGDWRVEPELNRISQGERRVSLRPQVMDLLLYLVDHRDQVVGIDELLSQLWEGRVVTHSSIYTSLKQLRQALDDDVNEPRYIRTIPKRGYRLIARVEFPREERLPGSTAPPRTPESEHDSGPDSLRPGLVTLGIFALLVYALFEFRLGDDRENGPPENFGPAQSVAVLPFTDTSPGQDQGWFCDGIAEDILDQLSRIPELKVSGVQSSFAFREPGADRNAIARTLGVSHLLEGSVYRDGGQVNVKVQLLDAATGFDLWSREYDQAVTNTIRIRQDIADNIGRVLTSRKSDNDTGEARLPTRYYPEFSTYELYLQARHLIRENTGESLRGALIRLKEALELDPDFAEAHVAMADTYDRLHASLTFYGDAPHQEASADMRRHLEMALAIDPHNARAWELQAELLDDPVKKLEAYRKALKANPNLASAHREIGLAKVNLWYSWNEVIGHMERALELDPLSLEAASVLAQFLVFVPHRQEDAFGIVDNIRNLHPGLPRVVRLEGVLFLNQGRLAEAVQILEQAFIADPDDGFARMYLNQAWFSLGETERAMESVHGQRHWQWVLSPDRETSLNQLRAVEHPESLSFDSRALSAYTFLMLREWQDAVDELAEYSFDLRAFRSHCSMMCGKRYSPALTLSTAYRALGEMERSRQFEDMEREAVDIRWEGGRIRSFEYSRNMARLNALAGLDYEAMLELEHLVRNGPIDPRELVHPAFDRFRNEPRFLAIEEIQRARVNAEREKLGFTPLPGGDQMETVKGQRIADSH